MKKLQTGLIVCLSLLAGNLFACTMVSPAAGIYSGGTFLAGVVAKHGANVVYYTITLLVIVILLKSLVFARLMASSTLRFFLVMILANVVTTLVGIATEFIHFNTGMQLFMLPAALFMIPLFILPVRVLRSLPRTPLWIQQNGALVIFLLVVLFAGISVLGAILTVFDAADRRLIFWALKILFGVSALSITLFLTATYEFSVIRKVSKCTAPSLLSNVLKANLLIYTILFTGVVVTTSLSAFS